MTAPTFEVREGKKRGRYAEDANVIEVDTLSFRNFPGRNGPVVDDLFIGYYEWGCEGDGHYLGTTLPPGKYKIIRVNDD